MAACFPQTRDRFATAAVQSHWRVSWRGQHSEPRPPPGSSSGRGRALPPCAGGAEHDPPRNARIVLGVGVRGSPAGPAGSAAPPWCRRASGRRRRSAPRTRRAGSRCHGVSSRPTPPRRGSGSFSHPCSPGRRRGHDALGVATASWSPDRPALRSPAQGQSGCCRQCRPPPARPAARSSARFARRAPGPGPHRPRQVPSPPPL